MDRLNFFLKIIKRSNVAQSELAARTAQCPVWRLAVGYVDVLKDLTSSGLKNSSRSMF